MGKRERKLCVIVLGMMRKNNFEKNDNKIKMDKRLQTLDERSSIFDNVQMCTRLIPAYS